MYGNIEDGELNVVAGLGSVTMAVYHPITTIIAAAVFRGSISSINFIAVVGR